ncbi:unnamed protein product [Plutella xylostella]|uniref:(diamondback moth) hypothetical protein n=1 Tax=Plutella xylostella TaxID=51655 RepID=A0A8S4GB07_PLUXY|nr:unnamed protein product [Plutella xylostella]
MFKMNKIARIPTRYAIAIMIYMSVLVCYAMRVNLSVNIIEMVPVVANGTNAEIKETLGWSAYERATVLGGYSWGFIASNILGGLVVQKLGPRNTILLSQLGSAILTFLSPLFAKISFLALTITRIVLGFLSGFIFPAIAGLIANWAVPNERGKFSAAVIGGTIGTVVAWSTLGVIIENYGWEWGFYSFGIVGVLFCLPWAYIVYDTPYNHPRIEEAEKLYIQDGIPKNNTAKPLPPYWRILTNVPSTFGLATGIGAISGILTPLVVAHFTKEDETSLDNWKPVFYIGSGIYVFSAIIFVLFGSTKVQALNEVKHDEYTDKKTEKV